MPIQWSISRTKLRKDFVLIKQSVRIIHTLKSLGNYPGCANKRGLNYPGDTVLTLTVSNERDKLSKMTSCILFICRIEDALSNMFTAVQRLFRALYIQPKRPVTEDFLGAVDQVRQRLRKQLRDYEAYLAVKAQRNIAITRYANLM